ncbi:HAMP domain-containing protein, partial [Isoptericola rhizosphaerae]|uniref:HAMP domain-containing protein n=1 Tax=Isoptericola rhizosphaerae TaxID=3377837 RepID=UPI00383B5B4B
MSTLLEKRQPALAPVATAPRETAARDHSQDGARGPRRFALRSIRTKIVGLVALLVAFMVMLGLVATANTIGLRDSTERIASVQTTLSAQLNAVDQSVWMYNEAVGAIGEYLGRDVDVSDKLAAIDDAKARIGTEMAAFEAIYTGMGVDVPAEYVTFRTAVETYLAAVESEKLPAFESGDWDTFQASEESLGALGGELGASLGGLKGYIEGVLADETEAAAQEAAGAIFILVVLIVVGAVGGLVTGWIVVSRIRAGLMGVQRTIEKMASGDLTHEPEVTSQDELGEMARSLSVTQAALRETLSGVLASSETIATGSDQLAAAASRVVAAAEQSSAQSGVAASAAEQVSQNVQTVAAGAEEMGASI